MILTKVPVDIGREDARDAAREELSRAVYHADDPSLPERALRWVAEQVAELLDRAASSAPGGYGGLLVLLVLTVLAVVLLRAKVGPLARSSSSETPLFTGRAVTAADHRRAADAHAAAGRWAEAVRERLRALVRDLEHRGLVEQRAGRTADEAATEAGQVLPQHAPALRAAARTFDDVVYGDHPATAQMHESIRRLDEAVRHTRPSPSPVGRAR